MELIAKKSLRYAGRSLVAGDKFEASARDARLLKAIRKAEDAPVIVSTVVDDTPTATHEKPGRKGQYRTRRMKVEAATGEDVAEEENTEE